MDPDIKKLVILLIFQMSVLITLECMAKEETRIFWVIGNNFVAWHLHCTDSNELVGEGDVDCGLMIEVCSNLIFLTRTCWAHQIQGSSRDGCEWMSPHLSTYIVFSHRTCKDAIQTCA